MEDVIPNEGCVITVSHLGFIKRTPVADYRSQKRGGKGVIGTETYEEDFVEHLFTASTHDYILFLTNTGQCHAKKVYDVPEGTRASKGKSVSSFLRLAEGEKIAAMICVKDFADDRSSRHGHEERRHQEDQSLADYANAPARAACAASSWRPETTPCRLRAHDRRERDHPARQPQGPGRAVQGEAMTCATRAATRSASPACASSSMATIVEASRSATPGAQLLVAREDGIGKRTPFEDYRLISRGGTGVIAIDLPEDGSVNVAGALSVRDDGEVMLLTAKGQSVRTRVSEIRETGRGAKGVKLLDLAEGDKLLYIARVVETDADEQDAEPPPVPAAPNP